MQADLYAVLPTTPRKLGVVSVDTFSDATQQLQPAVLFAADHLSANATTLRGLAMFRKNCVPAWEHASNSDGGDITWVGAADAALISKLWLFGASVLFATSAKQVCGFRMIHKNKPGQPLIKLEIWLQTCDKTDQLQQMLSSLLQNLHMPGRFKAFVSHADKLARV